MRISRSTFGALACVFTISVMGCSKDPTSTDEPDVGESADVAADVADAGPSDGSFQDWGPVADVGPDLSEPDGGPDMGDSLSLEEFCDAMAVGALEEWFACWGLPQHDPSGEESDARTNLRARCLRESTRSINEGTTSFDEEQARRCIQAVAELAGTCTQKGPPSRYLEECSEVYVPQVEPGGECMHRVSYFNQVDECIDGVCTKPEGQNPYCPGTCVALPAAGEACVQNSCEAGAYCDDGMCRAYAGEDEPCDRTAGPSCGDGLDCLSSSGTCVPIIEVGEPCDPAGVCRATISDDQGVTASLCIEGVCRTTVDPGEPCTGTVVCTGDARCEGVDPETGTLGTCVAPGVQGEDCPCADGFYCDADVCQPLPTIGETCDAATPCAEGWCRTTGGVSQCAALVNVGGDCSTDGNNPRGLGCVQGAYCMSDDTCREPAGDGEPCATSEAASCQGGLFCDPVTETCIPLAAEGETCNPRWNVDDENQSCQGDLGCVCTVPGECDVVANVQCTELRTAGEECDVIRCEDGLVCANYDGSRFCVDLDNPMCE
jgi:hypothetical protein